ncbi:hypothetical protein, partial [Anaerobiospirillum succiniciproducens]|uniref:hypothetical protein n=1 Tax=Anaerobiospirillum succiniciproducens TaxID=13335 RepID=UPI00248D8358
MAFLDNFEDKQNKLVPLTELHKAEAEDAQSLFALMREFVPLDVRPAEAKYELEAISKVEGGFESAYYFKFMSSPFDLDDVKRHLVHFKGLNETNVQSCVDRIIAVGKKDLELLTSVRDYGRDVAKLYTKLAQSDTTQASWQVEIAVNRLNTDFTTALCNDVRKNMTNYEKKKFTPEEIRGKLFTAVLTHLEALHKVGQVLGQVESSLKALKAALEAKEPSLLAAIDKFDGVKPKVEKPAKPAKVDKPKAEKPATKKVAAKKTTAKSTKTAEKATTATKAKAPAKTATKATATKTAEKTTATKAKAPAKTATKATATKTAAKTTATKAKAPAKTATKATATKTAAKTTAAKAKAPAKAATKASATKTAAKTTAAKVKAPAKTATKATATKTAA